MIQLPHSTSPIPSNPFQLKDFRLTQRYHQIVRSLQAHPEKSFPSIFKKPSELQGFYRFMNNEAIEFSELMKVSQDSSIEAMQAHPLVLAVHDTTAFEFTHAPGIEGLGRLTSGKRGFFGHFCLAATLRRELLGVLGLETWVRSPEKKKKRVTQQDYDVDTQRESFRWLRLIQSVQSQTSSPSLIHVADREADDYASFCEFQQHTIRYVFRSNYNRKIKDPELSKLWDSLQQAQAICSREVHISARVKADRPHEAKTHPPRQKRIAHLGISAKSVEVCRPQYTDKKYPKTLSLNFVRIFEINPPEGETPIEWILVTSEPIQTPEDLYQIVDIYRARWCIEEYFKALKTGCNFEKRGLESLPALLNCLALFAPIACQLYNLKVLGREYPEQSSAPFVTQAQIQILKQKTGYPEQDLLKLGTFMKAVAQLGGHIKYNGPPGWQVLARGYEELLQLEQGYLLALKFTSLLQPGATCAQ